MFISAHKKLKLTRVARFFPPLSSPPLGSFAHAVRPADKIFYLPLAMDPRPFAYQLMYSLQKNKKEKRREREGRGQEKKRWGKNILRGHVSSPRRSSPWRVEGRGKEKKNEIYAQFTENGLTLLRSIAFRGSIISFEP